MNYLTHYNKLITKARNRILNEYCEKHHIIPKCIGGNNDPNNIVNLTAEEHFIAHLLLIKIYPDNIKILYAFQMMNVSCKNHKRKNKLYGWAKRKLNMSRTGIKRGKYKKSNKIRKKRAKETKVRKPRILSESHKAKIGLKIKGRKLSEETKHKIKISNLITKNFIPI